MRVLKDYPRIIREIYAAHLVLHIGCQVPLEDLYLTKALVPDGSSVAVAVLARQDDLEFTLTCGPFDMSEGDLGRLWLEAIPVINKASVEERVEATENTLVLANAAKIIEAFLAKRKLNKRKREQN